MKILGISCFYHEASACYIKDGKIIAASAEERFSRIKHDKSFPSQSIDFCLSAGGIRSNELDYVVYYEKPFLKFERNLLTSLRFFPKSANFFIDFIKNFIFEKLWIKSIIASNFKIDSDKILFVPHHLSHASASFYPSPFKQAAYLTLDGIGEWTTCSWGYAKDNRLYPKKEIKFPDSVGLLYSSFTAYLGFEVNDGEYKVMGMAGYGKPKFISKVKKLYKQNKDGSIKLNLDYFVFHYSSQKMYSQKFNQLFDGLNKFDIASSLQVCLEEIVLNMLSYIKKQTGQDNLVFGGGVALNSVLNGKITKIFKNVFIFSAAGDDGGAVGAALYVYHHVLGFKNRVLLKDVFLGVEFDNKQIKDQLIELGVKFMKMDEKKLIDYIAFKLTLGKVVGWFEGRAEFGSRALGARSILADPRNPKMKDIINLKIKFREEFRPFAPAVLAEYADKYFKNVNQNLAKFMLGTFKTKPITRKIAPAIVHVDQTSRVQIVDRNYSMDLRKLLERFFKMTKVPILLNTSFNLKGEPIVNSPKDAYNTFIKSGLDILVMENYVIEKPN